MQGEDMITLADLRKQVREIILDTLQISEDENPEELSADTVKQWDSLGHIRLVSQLEERLSLSIPQSQIPDLWHEDAIVDAAARLLNIKDR
ncbi:MAG: acyl carrier protein [Candidatus Glassbacteria bacterium]|nr:acyl carrier protein [Candidatus Glassbacteria bacterium]